MASAKFKNIVDMFEQSVKAFGPRELFGTKIGGQWTWTTYAETAKQVDAFRAGLVALGIQRGDRIAFISDNRVEWAVAAYACFGIGAAVVPMYEAQVAKEWAFICNDCGAVAVIAASDAIHAKCKELQEKAPSIKHVIGLALPKSDPLSYAGLLASGAKPVAAIDADGGDTACIIYTSGTTGNPKGVILTHDNLMSNVNGVQEFLPIAREDRSLSFLPWAHSFGFTCELLSLTSCGASMALCEAVDKIVANLSEVRPTVLMSVPRIFNRIYDNVNKQMAGKPAPIRALFNSGLAAAKKKKRGEALGLLEKLTLAVADKVVFGKIRDRFGGRLQYAFSGGAALSREVAEFIDALGITVYEGYGLTETSPITTVNRPGEHRLGTVGKPLPQVRVVIDTSASGDPEQGEVVVYGPNVMKGYYNRDEENKAVFTKDGGFRTGDLGVIDADGYLRITGRIKEQYKLENGKYIAPAPLEEQLKLSPFIVNSMVYGDNRLYNVALVIPDMEALKAWASENGIKESDDEKLLQNERVKKQIQSEVDKFSSSFKGFERVKKVALSAEDFTTQNGLLTPSLKLKRRVAWQKYGPAIEALYAEPAPPKQAAAAP